MYRDEANKLVRLKCSCCRGPIRTVRKTSTEKLYKCVNCSWESPLVMLGEHHSQSELDAMNLNEKNRETRKKG